MTEDRIIGRENELPWHLPEDLKFFKRTTSGHPIVMGRKTFESIGRPLPRRQNIVLTRDEHWEHEGVDVVHSLEELKCSELSAEGPVFIIGGAQIYEALLSELDELIVTHVHESHAGDTRFPEFQSQFTEGEVLLDEPDFTVKRWTLKKN